MQCNERNGCKIPMHLKMESAQTSRGWKVRDKNTNPKIESWVRRQEATGKQDCKSEIESADSTIPCGTSCRGISRRSSRTDGGASCG